ncbi:DUF721 domain-containing protein [bacterium]|nr:DUF721 domain-containing protein [candidate division CSSED10-310 bacterium]
MNMDPGDLGIRRAVLDILLDLPHDANHRVVMTRMIWDWAAGSIIAGHASIRAFRPDGRIILAVDDSRWIPELRSSSGLIIERMNRLFNELECDDYIVRSLEIHLSAQSAPKKNRHIEPLQIVIPDEILDQTQEMPEDTRRAFLEWYKAVRAYQSGNCIR